MPKVKVRKSRGSVIVPVISLPPELITRIRHDVETV